MYRWVREGQKAEHQSLPQRKLTWAVPCATMQVQAALGGACLVPAAGKGHLPQEQCWAQLGWGLCATKTILGGGSLLELALALTCPLCCSPGCSRFGAVRSHILPSPARASRTRRLQRARQTPSWRLLCSTAACSLWEDKGGLHALNKTTGNSCQAHQAAVHVLHPEGDQSLEESVFHKIRRKLLANSKLNFSFVCFT